MATIMVKAHGLAQLPLSEPASEGACKLLLLMRVPVSKVLPAHFRMDSPTRETAALWSRSRAKSTATQLEKSGLLDRGSNSQHSQQIQLACAATLRGL